MKLIRSESELLNQKFWCTEHGCVAHTLNGMLNCPNSTASILGEDSSLSLTRSGEQQSGSVVLAKIYEKIKLLKFVVFKFKWYFLFQLFFLIPSSQASPLQSDCELLHTTWSESSTDSTALNSAETVHLILVLGVSNDYKKVRKTEHSMLSIAWSTVAEPPA